MGEKMNLKKLGVTIIEFTRHPMHIVVFVWLSVKLMKEMHDHYVRETALERMIYSKRR